MQTEKVVDHIVNWLKDYATNANMNGFVLGISGGIDSAVVSALCAKTGLRTLCVEIPIHQHKSQVTRAQQHISFLKEHFANVSNLEVDLTPVFEEFKNAVPPAEENPNTALALANTRARLRMTTLYYFAGLHGYLVAGTGNKVEDFGVGFFTKYGDGGVDLSPIADLMKSEVYDIARFLELENDIIEAIPTDGLFDDSPSDEEQIGASYDELEWAMKKDDEGHQVTSFSGREQEVFKIYKRLNLANQHKINPIPVCEIPVHLKN
ncbi:NAD(+) synthase [Antarcticibacterium flavum]|uniref:NH(3)-dependent NAD(+) synthetase n=1 Tax=Antarcticibacterium flavum TaxID=2058175 RepID=A0A5B7X0T6_9FLAO|nr:MULTISPECIES: NAD(+) synthase [Antarcticibacterium]MCM4159859.1 NAD(+) synthase [Antarcticibacterium sp. W02-3]QCY68860.1 NAD(+) synthase [Antarcticibacterium flavum]